MSEFTTYLKHKHSVNLRWLESMLNQDATSIHLLKAENEAIERTLAEFASIDPAAVCPMCCKPVFDMRPKAEQPKEADGWVSVSKRLPEMHETGDGQEAEGRVSVLVEAIQMLMKSRKETEATGRLGWVYVADELLDEVAALAAAKEAKMTCNDRCPLPIGSDYYCQLTTGHSGDHWSQCHNPQFNQYWSNNTSATSHPLATEPGEAARLERAQAFWPQFVSGLNFNPSSALLTRAELSQMFAVAFSAQEVETAVSEIMLQLATETGRADTWMNAAEAAREQRDRAEQRDGKLEEALRKYGKHQDDCAVYCGDPERGDGFPHIECTCDFSATLAEVTPLVTPPAQGKED